MFVDASYVCVSPFRQVVGGTDSERTAVES